MLLYGASVLLKKTQKLSQGSLPKFLPSRSWARDHNKKTPFDAAYDMSLKSAVEEWGLHCSPPCTESLVLLANRGCGEVEKVDELSTKRINLMQLLKGEEVTVGPVVYPRNDISMGSERFKIPWVNETGGDAERRTAGAKRQQKPRSTYSHT